MKPRRIVVTGGPGGGKTTAVDLFRRELAPRVAVVPEAATLVFAGGFPRSGHAAVARASQTAIFHVQRNLEEATALLEPGRVLVCDRGTVDGAAYWPGSPRSFFEAMRTTAADELARYDAVVFFESAAVGGSEISPNNPHRIERQDEATVLDARLRALWSRHPHFTLVPHSPSFFAKLSAGLDAIRAALLGAGH